MMFDRIEIAEHIYEGQTQSKKIPRADSNCDSHVRKRSGGEDTSTTNLDKGRSDKHKTKNAVSLSEKTTGGDKP